MKENKSMSSDELAQLLAKPFVNEILRTLETEPQPIEGLLHGKLEIAKPQITDRVNLLIQKGLIREAKTPQHDKTLELTDYGRRVLAALDETTAKIKLMIEKARKRQEQD